MYHGVQDVLFNVFIAVLVLTFTSPSCGITLSHIPLYCTSNFSLLSLLLCLPPLSSPPLSAPSEWRLRIDGGCFSHSSGAGMPIYGVLHHAER